MENNIKEPIIINGIFDIQLSNYSSGSTTRWISIFNQTNNFTQNIILAIYKTERLQNIFYW